LISVGTAAAAGSGVDVGAISDERARRRLERSQLVLTDSMVGSIDKLAELAQLRDVASETRADVADWRLASYRRAHETSCACLDARRSRRG
jgi:hypothetical protein